jgi:hypothetical protein
MSPRGDARHAVIVGWRGAPDLNRTSVAFPRDSAYFVAIGRVLIPNEWIQIESDKFSLRPRLRFRVDFQCMQEFVRMR